MRLGLALRELEQVERALDVDLVRGHRRELGARREQRREMKDQFDLELGEDALEELLSRIDPVISRSTCGAIDGSSRRDVERDDGARRLTASRSIRPWPISPPAPVMSTTGLRTRELYWRRHAHLVGRGVFAALAQSPVPANSPFDFTRTMRVDYVHTGGPNSGETIALDRVVNDGAWAGSRTQLVDA